MNKLLKSAVIIGAVMLATTSSNALSLVPEPPAQEIVNIDCLYRKFDKSALYADGLAVDKMLAAHGYRIKRGKYGENVFLVDVKFIKMTKITEEDNIWKVGKCDFQLRSK